MKAPLQAGADTEDYRGYTIIKRWFETAAVFRRGKCVESGLIDIPAAKAWIDQQIEAGSDT